MAKGKFSQPRQPRREENDFDAVMRRRRETQAPPIEPQVQPVAVRNPDLEETVLISETMVVKELPLQEEAASFEETQFLKETADIPPISPAAPSAPVYPAEPAQEAFPEADDEDEDMDEEEEEAPRRKSRKGLIITLCIVTVLLIGAIIGGVMLFLNTNADDGLILNNVSVAGVNIGGMTPEEAKSAIHRATDLTYGTQDMVVQLPDTTLYLSPADTKVKLNVDAVVEAAYNYGRSGTTEENKKAQAESAISTHTIALLPYLNLNTDYIRQQLDAYGETFISIYAPSSYTLEGDQPDLTAEGFDEKTPCQTLILDPGMPGRNLNLDKIYNDILDAYSLNQFKVEAAMSAPEEIPEALDLDVLFKELHIDAVDASMDMETFEVTPEAYGYTFDLEKAKAMLSETAYGDTVGIPLEYIMPKVLSKDLDGKLFRDVLASYETKHTDDSNRNHNLKLACKAINGIILQPGDVFDYDKTLGKRTAEAGYKEAGALMAGETIKELGGGICQVSSTLYHTVLHADLEVVERRAHSLVSSYMPIGLDATVSWKSVNLRFKNNTDFPIRIEAEVSDGKVKVKLLGTDERDYYIKMETKTVEVIDIETEYEEYTAKEAKAKGYKDGQILKYGNKGYTVYSYRCKYDKETDKLISKDYEATSNYVMNKNKVVKVLPEETTAPPETTVPPTTQAPTTPPTAKPTEPPVTQPAATEPPATQAPAQTTPPATQAPAQTTPPATQAPAQTTPPATQAPAQTTPPATQAPAQTTPPATQAPAQTTPPATQAPAQTTPPATQPAATEPPATQISEQTPPATQAPAQTTPPATQAPAGTDAAA